MKGEHKHKAFSLTEVLMAVGILAVGMIFIAGLFPVGMRFATIATERTIAAVATDEAFAKIRLYGFVSFNSPSWPPDPTIACVDFNDVSLMPVDPDEFAYPSTDTNPAGKQYYWSALCRRVGLSDVQVTVFVCRKAGASKKYWHWDPLIDPFDVIPVGNPVPVRVEVSTTGNPHELEITNTTYRTDERPFINDGYTIVDNQTGRLYRVLERDPDRPEIIVLDRPWQGSAVGVVWVIPPAVAGGRYPCVGVYQKVIRF